MQATNLIKNPTMIYNKAINIKRDDTEDNVIYSKQLYNIGVGSRGTPGAGALHVYTVRNVIFSIHLCPNRYP